MGNKRKCQDGSFLLQTPTPEPPEVLAPAGTRILQFDRFSSVTSDGSAGPVPDPGWQMLAHGKPALSRPGGEQADDNQQHRSNHRAAHDSGVAAVVDQLKLLTSTSGGASMNSTIDANHYLWQDAFGIEPSDNRHLSSSRSTAEPAAAASDFLVLLDSRFITDPFGMEPQRQSLAKLGSGPLELSGPVDFLDAYLRQPEPGPDKKQITKRTDDDSPVMERGQWSGKLDFIFSCISYAVGLGNVWRFPYLCYENGGGAFLVPYLVCIFILGVPLFLMEVSLGQYFHAGGVAIWNQVPVLKGVGFASMIMIGLCNTYYIVIIAWTLYYLFSSMQVPLPWMSCENWWNTDRCFTGVNSSTSGGVSAAQQFWERKALDISGDMAEIGSIQWHLLATLVLAWALVYAVIYKGIHQSGKIIWVMAIFPYVILTILFGYGLSLEGALTGIQFYITPKWYKLKEAKIWVAAGTQLLFTYGIGIGTNIALGSYNPTKHNFYRDSFIACLLSSFTSLFSGFVIFSVLGHMAHTMGSTVADVARSGPGLAFIVYPEAVTRLPVPNLWAILFFTMLLVLGIDSQFCTVESFVTGLVDEWPRMLRPHRKLFTLLVVLVHLVLGISMITSGGMYVFQLMDNFSASGVTLIIVVLIELVAFGWIFGGARIYNQMVEMLGFRPPRLLLLCWCYISPLCLLAILVFSVVDYQPPEYAGRPFPWYGELFGWSIASASIIFIPGYMLYYLFYKADQRLSLCERIRAGFWPPPQSNNNNNHDDDNNNNSGGSPDLEHASGKTSPIQLLKSAVGTNSDAGSDSCDSERTQNTTEARN